MIVAFFMPMKSQKIYYKQKKQLSLLSMCPGTELNRYDRCGSPRFKIGACLPIPVY
jgi:hypothetical protein